MSDHTGAIEELEYLASQLNSLREAEDLAIGPNRKMLPELERLHRSAVRQIIILAKRILRSRVALGVRGPDVSIEQLERMFPVLRDQAEIAWVRSMKVSGKKSRLVRTEADAFARLAHEAAETLKAALERTDRWSDAYAQEHGLESWL